MKLILFALVMSFTFITRANAASTNEAFGLRSMVHLVTDARSQVISATESGEVSDFQKLHKVVEDFTDQCILTLSLDDLSIDQRLAVSNTLKSLRVIIQYAGGKLDDLHTDKTFKVEELETFNPNQKQDLSDQGLTIKRGKELLIMQLKKEVAESARLGNKFARLSKLLDEQITRFYQ